MGRGLSWRRVAAMGLLWLAGAPSGASAEDSVVNPEQAYQAETEIQIEGANPWGAVLISKGRELLVAERKPSEMSFSIRDAATGRELRRLRPRGVGWYPVWSISADGARIALGTLESEANGVVVIDVSTDEEIQRLPMPDNRLFKSVAISSDGRRVAAIGTNFVTWGYVWEIETGLELRRFRARYADTIALSPDGAMVLTSVSVDSASGGLSDAIAEVWDVGSGRRISEVKVRDASFNRALFSADGKTFLTANVGGIRGIPNASSVATLWETTTGREVAAIGRGDGGSVAISISADGSRIATASMDRRVRIWDAITGDLIASLPVHGSSGDATPDRNSSGFAVSVPESVEPRMAPAFSTEGTSLVTSALDGSVKVWVDAAERQASDQAALSANLAAAQRGDVEAMHSLAFAYREGRGTARNDTLATQWLTKAADGGHGLANLELASAMLSGDGGRQDCVAGGERLRKAVASGSADAAARLDAVLSPLGGRDGAAALTPQIQADLLEAQIIEVLTRQDYPAFLANLCALEVLGHADRLPVGARRELIYHRAAGLRAAGKPRAALAALNQYLNEAGSTGASYTQAIQMLRPLQQEAK